MGRVYRSKWSSRLMVLGAAGVFSFFTFGSFGTTDGPLGTGQRKVMAQPSGTLQATSGTLEPSGTGPIAQSAAFVAPTPAQIAASEAQMERAAAGMAARGKALPASGARVSAAAAPPAAETQSTARSVPVRSAASGPLADSDFTFFRATQLSPAAGGLSSSAINEPSVAQNGKYVFETFNWGAARSVNGGATWAYISPYAGMGDFCCDQDVIYDKGRDKMFWLRQGLSGSFASPFGGTENRDLITVDTGAAGVCSYDIRPSITANAAFNNTWFDYPRISLSDNYLYVSTNVFTNAGGFFTHFLIRFKLSEMASCATTPFSFWSFSDGWAPALVENAREIMYLGDQIVTSSGLNDQFRVYWIFDDNTTLNFVDRTIAPYQFTNRFGAHCPVPGGVDPCQRADQRITGGVLEHNTPVPGNLGAAGDKVDFFWNVQEGNGFTLPYVESAGFFGNTIAYVQRKFIWNSSVTFFYAAAGANDREHVGLSLMQFNPVATGANPYHLVGIDDDYNSNPPPWELYVSFASTAAWGTSGAGDYLRARTHSPSGVAWIASGYTRNAAAGNAYLPHFLVFGRARDLAGFSRFDQQ